MSRGHTLRGGPRVSIGHRAVRPVLAATVVLLLAALPSTVAATTTTIRSLPAPQVETVLGKTPLATLEAGKLAELLSGLPGLGGVEAKALEQSLTETIEAMAGKGATLGSLLSSEEAATLLAAKLKEALGPVVGKLLETLLGGPPVAQLEAALGSTSPQAVLGELLTGAGAPATLATQILGAIESASVQELLGSPLGGEPFTLLNAGELATKAGTSLAALAEGVGLAPAELQGSALALTKPLSETLTLGVLGGTKGVTLGLLETTVEKGKEVLGGGGSGGSGGGGSGGAGGSGGSSPGTTVLLGSVPVGAPAPTHPAAAGKLKVLSHRVRGRRATVVVQVPGAGTLATSARGVRRAHRETSRPERLTLHLALTGAGAAAVRRHRLVKVSLRVSFRPVTGATSAASVPLTFR